MEHSGRTSYERELREGRREREFFRYYAPVQALSQGGLPLCDLNDDDAVQAHRPTSSPDKALTAFCQLGAIRLDARRAMMFFFDAEYAYILAESTRTLSLQDDSVYDEDDSLWLGSTVIPRGQSICEHTVNMTSKTGDHGFGRIHVVPDLRDSAFCGRPYAVGGPMARFYAGVPITTPRGINIGAYCILDDLPRPAGLSERDIVFMTRMSDTIMTHLEMIRAKAQNGRATMMTAGISAFVEGSSSLTSGNETTGGVERQHAVRAYQKLGVKRSAIEAPSARRNNNLPDGRSTPTRRAQPESPDPIADASRTPLSYAPGEPVASASDRRFNPNDHENGSPARKNSQTMREQGVATEIRRTFQRAAQLVCEALDVDGTMFFDASVASYTERINRRTDSASSESNGSAADSSKQDAEAPRTELAADRVTQDKSCDILGSSVTSSGHDTAQLVGSDASKRMSQKFLQRLLNRWPMGRIWSFDREGRPSSDDGSTAGSQRSTSKRSENRESDKDASKATAGTTRKRARMDYGKEIQRLFPGVRSLAVVGMFDHVKNRWSAACAIWVYSPLRTLSTDSEVSFLNAFCDVVLAQVQKVEAELSDKAKIDFISSISHELRSPLHGILGSVECLQEQPLDLDSQALVTNIDVCGRALLDCFDHLLGYSKINSHRNKRSNEGKQSQTSSIGGGDTQEAHVKLDKLTEEVVGAVVYSHSYSRPAATILDRKVGIVLNIERFEKVDWGCHIDLGAWKRLCMNLVSNALKYTDQGYVDVSLGAAPTTAKRKKFDAVLKVSDTGRGMTKAFQDHHLFEPFAQEDGLMEGNGLGMSLVANIVKNFGGHIDVNSEVGAGTTVTVSVPLGLAPAQLIEPELGLSITASQPFRDRSIGILDLATGGTAEDDLSCDMRRRGRLKVLDNLQDSCIAAGLTTSWVKSADEQISDCYLVLEADFAQRSSSSSLSRVDGRTRGYIHNHKPLIVLCESTLSRRQLEAELHDDDEVSFMSQPAGPEQLAKAVRGALEPRPLIRHPDRLPVGRPPSQISSARSSHQKDLLTRIVSRPRLRRRHSSNAIMSRASQDVLIPSGPAEVGISPAAQSTLDGPLKLERTRSHPREVKVSKKGLNLLLVDDNPINLKLLTTYANKHNHPYTTAINGLEALEAYKAAASPAPEHPPTLATIDRPQAILLDINMPIMDGFEATRQIRQFESEKRLFPTTIIALTGLGNADAQREAYGSGVDLFLTKPVRLKELARVLERVAADN